MTPFSRPKHGREPMPGCASYGTRPNKNWKFFSASSRDACVIHQQTSKEGEKRLKPKPLQPGALTLEPAPYWGAKHSQRLPDWWHPAEKTVKQWQTIEYHSRPWSFSCLLARPHVWSRGQKFTRAGIPGAKTAWKVHILKKLAKRKDKNRNEKSVSVLLKILLMKTQMLREGPDTQ